MPEKTIRRIEKDLLHSGVMGVLTGLTRTLSWVIYCDGRRVSDASFSGVWMLWPGSGAGGGGQRISNLFKRVGINENPAKLNDLGGILCHIYTVFIAGSRNVDHDVAVDVELRHLLRSHDSNGSPGSRQLACARCRQRRSTLKRSPGRLQWLVVRDKSKKTRSESLGPLED